MALFSEKEIESKMIFEQQQQLCTQVQWVDNISGDFITIYDKPGIIKIWNAA